MQAGDLIYHEDWKEYGILINVYGSVLFEDDRLAAVLFRGRSRQTDVLLSSLKRKSM